MAILPKAIYVFNAIPIKIPMTFCTEIDKNNCEIYMEIQKTLNSQSYWSKKSNAEGITIANFKLYYRTKTIKSTYCHIDRQEDEWLRIEDPDINSRIYSQLNFDKGAQNTQWKKDSLFNKCC
jgi:hypothetical protein